METAEEEDLEETLPVESSQPEESLQSDSTQESMWPPTLAPTWALGVETIAHSQPDCTGPLQWPWASTAADSDSQPPEDSEASHLARGGADDGDGAGDGDGTGGVDVGGAEEVGEEEEMGESTLLDSAFIEEEEDEEDGDAAAPAQAQPQPDATNPTRPEDLVCQWSAFIFARRLE